MFLNQIKHINVDFDSRIFVNLPISANFYFYSRNLGEFNKKNRKFTAVLKALVYDTAHIYHVMIKKHVDISIEPP